MLTVFSIKNIPGNTFRQLKKEIEDIKPILKNAGEETDQLTEDSFPDSLRSGLSKYNFIHLATHGFYVDSSTAKNFYDRTWDKEAIQNDPMMRCGIAVSAANFPSPKSLESEGHLMGFELANTDLRNCYLISLSACETGLGDLRNNLGVDGLSRALKLGGAKYLLISLWKVPDAPTAVFMQQFYKELFRLKDPAVALQSTQTFMSKKYTVAEWAAFVLVE
jgi:CHAT domain-containing protein